MIVYLIVVKGVGFWIVEVYLMFCVGYLDIFLVGDIVFVYVVYYVFGYDDKLKGCDFVVFVECWLLW